MSHSVMIQKALVFLDEQLRLEPARNLSALCDEAGMRFNLSPLEVDSLCRIFREEQEPISD